MGTLGIPTLGNRMLDVVIFVAFVYQILLMYIKFGLHLRMSEVTLPIMRKVLFAVFLGSMAFFGDFFKLVLAERTGMTAYITLFSSIPGVAITIVIWAHFVMALQFRPLHALEISVYAYLFFQTISGVTRLVSAVFFAQNPLAIDYQKYILMYATNFFISVGFLFWMQYILKHKPNLLTVKGINSGMPKKSIAFAIFQLFFIYICAALIMLLIPKTIVGSLISLVMLLLFSAFSITLNSNRYAQMEILAKETQVQSMFESLDQFGAIKHDFYNILQTYNGYFEIGDLEACKRYHQSLVEITTATGNLLDLNRRAVENPALVALLLNKQARAGSLNVQLKVSLDCPLSELPIKDIDICRVVGCLLDNAIEAAAESKEKEACFTIEGYGMRSKRIIITNSCLEPVNIQNAFAPGRTSKKGHQGIGLVNAKKIIEQYPHCTLQMHAADRQVIARIGLESEAPVDAHTVAK